RLGRGEYDLLHSVGFRVLAQRTRIGESHLFAFDAQRQLPGCLVTRFVEAWERPPRLDGGECSERIPIAPRPLPKCPDGRPIAEPGLIMDLELSGTRSHGLRQGESDEFTTRGRGLRRDTLPADPKNSRLNTQVLSV